MKFEEFAACRDDIKNKYECNNKDFNGALNLLFRLKIRLENETSNFYPNQHWYVNYDIGYCKNALGAYEESNDYIYKALGYLNSKEDPDYGKTVWMLGNNYGLLKQNQLAKEYYYEAYEFFEKKKQIANKMIISMNLTYIDKNIYQLYKIVEEFVNLDEEELLNNADVYLDTILPNIISLADEIKGSNGDLYYNKIIIILYNSRNPLIRKKLLTLSC